MLNLTQHWQACIPLRAQVLGLLFLLFTLAVFAVLWWRWQLPVGPYLGVCFFMLLYLAYFIKVRSSPILRFATESGFELQEVADYLPVDILHVWHNDWLIAVRLRSRHNITTLVFWRESFSLSAWKQLTILLLHYQLQYQFADHKGAP